MIEGAQFTLGFAGGIVAGVLLTVTFAKWVVHNWENQDRDKEE